MSSDPDPEGTEELACRQSFTILTTDGFWNGNTPSSIGDADGSTGPTITSPSSQPYTYSPVLPYADGGDRKSVVSGKSVSVRVDLGGRRIIKKKTNQIKYNTRMTEKRRDKINNVP